MKAYQFYLFISTAEKNQKGNVQKQGTDSTAATLIVTEQHRPL